MEDAPNNYPEQSWDRRGDPSRARDCAGAVMQNLMARFNAEIEPDKRAYAFGADNFVLVEIVGTERVRRDRARQARVRVRGRQFLPERPEAVRLGNQDIQYPHLV